MSRLTMVAVWSRKALPAGSRVALGIPLMIPCCTATAYLSNLANWEKSNPEKRGREPQPPQAGQNLVFCSRIRHTFLALILPPQNVAQRIFRQVVIRLPQPKSVDFWVSIQQTTLFRQ